MSYKTQMKKPTIIIFLLFVSISNLLAQCPDSSDATLQETTDWIISKIESYGGRSLPPTRYEVKFEGSQMTISEFGFDSNLEIKDTVSVVKVNLRDLDLNKLETHSINKSNTRYALIIDAKENKMSYHSPILGEMGTGYEMIIDCSKQSDLTSRIIKALNHCYCLSGGNTVKEKF